MFTRLTLISTLSVVALAACATPQENPYYKYSSQYKGAPVTTVAQAPAVIQTAPVSYDAVSYESAQPASYSRVNHECLRKEKNHELLGAGIGGTIGAIAGKKLIGGTEGLAIGAGLGGVAGYGLGDKSVTCDPQTVVMEQTVPVISTAYASPTDTEFMPISETGTPGYQALSAQTVEIYKDPAQSALVSQPPSTSSAQAVSYDYTANMVSASTDSVAMSTDTRIIGSENYGSHIVSEGDTVYSLSRKLCVDLGDIQSLNNLDASYGISIGQTLSLPSSRC